MVCYGPSRGCQRCRQRKIKCDEQRPSCGQCQRSRKDCPGYDRGDGKACFRNPYNQRSRSRAKKAENSTVADTPSIKVETPTNGTSPATSTSPPGSASDSHRTNDHLMLPSDTIPRRHASDGCIVAPKTLQLSDFSRDTKSMSLSIELPEDSEQQAMGLFMTKFVDDPMRTEEIWGGSLELLSPLLRTAAPSGVLMAAATTAAMSAMACDPLRRNFRRKALTKYVQTLGKINEALQDPHIATSDDVLMSVLMLRFYENIKGLTMQKPANQSHTAGAVAIIKARRPQTFHKKESLRLYLSVKAQVLGQSIQDGDPTAYEEFELATAGSIPGSYEPSCADRLVLLSTGLPSLRKRDAVMQSTLNPNIKLAQARSLLQDASQTDAMINLWQSTVPAYLTPISTPLISPNSSSTTSNLLPRNFDVYHDGIITSTWNTWRTTRIKVLQMVMSSAKVVSALESTAAEAVAQYHNAAQQIDSLVHHICSSVPFCLGHHERGGGIAAVRVVYPHPPGQAQWPRHFVASEIPGAWLMIPPLIFISRLDCISGVQRAWVQEYLTTFTRRP